MPALPPSPKSAVATSKTRTVEENSQEILTILPQKRRASANEVCAVDVPPDIFYSNFEESEDRRYERSEEDSYRPKYAANKTGKEASKNNAIKSTRLEIKNKSSACTTVSQAIAELKKDLAGPRATRKAVSGCSQPNLTKEEIAVVNSTSASNVYRETYS